jgi:hypothetical protein
LFYESAANLDRFHRNAQTIAISGLSHRLKDHPTIAGKEDKKLTRLRVAGFDTAPTGLERPVKT